MNDILSWIEIPSVDFERAVQFYNTVLAVNLHKGDFAGIPHAFLTNAEGHSRGAIIHDLRHKPSTSGPLIYLYVNQLDEVLGRVAAAGGTVTLPATPIGEQGTVAIIQDTEGNRVGLHTAK